MGEPVWSLDDFSAVYLDRLQSGDAAGLGYLYVESAVLTTTGGPFGSSWVVGREQIIAMIAQAMTQYTVDEQTRALDVLYEWARGENRFTGPSRRARLGIEVNF